jgi:two-component system NtrC family response regulator
MVVLSNGDLLTVEDVPEEIRRTKKAIGGILIDLPDSGVDLEVIEKEIVQQALERNGWNQTAASKYLNVTRSILISRMQKYGLAATSEHTGTEAATHH